jgi:hypothetical protein
VNEDNDLHGECLDFLECAAQTICDVRHKSFTDSPLEELMNQPAPLKTTSWVTLVCTLVALGCGDATTGPDPDPNPNGQLSEVSVESNIDLVIAVGRTTQLNATVTNGDGGVVSGASLTWQTSDADVASVTGSGLVTSVGAGQVTITATHNSVNGSITLTIINADLAAIAQSRDDPLMDLLIAQLSSDMAQQLTDALTDLDEAITVGNCIAVRDALEAALSDTSGSPSPSEVVTLAVLGLVLERAQDLLGLD